MQTDWPPTLSAYLAPQDEAAIHELTHALQNAGALVETRIVQEEDWAEAWKQYFRPQRVGRRWYIRPTWEEGSPDPGDLVLVIDPGQAFGTGGHQTTRGCLQAMESLDLQGKEVADIGCGSGILSVAAGLMGAEAIQGVDVELASVEASRENAGRNHVSAEFFQGLGFSPLRADQTYDLVLSNIISAALIQLAPEAGRRVKPGGAWITSGVIQANWPDVRAAAEREGFALEDEIGEDDWVTARFRR
jgi:ribosomal protein L11 methyltransferase